MIRRFFSIRCICFFVAVVVFACFQAGITFSSNSESYFQSLLESQKFIDRGNEYLRQYEFDKAEQEFLIAASDKYAVNEADKRFALSKVILTRQLKGDYIAALEKIDWFFSLKFIGTKPVDQKKKMQALVSWKNTSDKQPIYQFIEEYKQKYKDRIPPKSKLADLSVLTTIVELYDLVGDYDAGMAWVKLFQKKVWGKADKKTKKEYEGLIQSFEESKRGMPKECSSDGKYCVGRATAYIIRSKYF